MQKNSLGDTLRELRKQKGLSQEDLAEGICSPVSISRIENGNQIPSQPVLEALLEKLGTGLYQICNVYYRSEQQQARKKPRQSSTWEMRKTLTRHGMSLSIYNKTAPTILAADNFAGWWRPRYGCNATTQPLRAIHSKKPWIWPKRRCP